jgi:hypothetical protein
MLSIIVNAQQMLIFTCIYLHTDTAQKLRNAYDVLLYYTLHALLNTTQAASAEVWRQKETERANHLESALEEATATVAQLKSQLTNSSGSLDTAVAPLRKQKLELELTLTEAQRKVQVLELEVQRIEVKHKADLSALQIEVASKVRNGSIVFD